MIANSTHWASPLTRSPRGSFQKYPTAATTKMIKYISASKNMISPYCDGYCFC